MNAVIPVFGKQFRLAQHYLGKLRSANRAYKGGDEGVSYGLKIAQQDWPQIQQWQAWATSRAGDQPEAAQMCSAYSLEGGELLDLILSPQEQRVWCETGLSAARQEGDQRAELAHLLVLSVVYERLGHEKPANDCALQALALAEHFNDQNSMGQACLLLGSLTLRQGDYAASREYLQQSLQRFRLLRNRRDLASALYSLGRIAFAAHDLPLCRDYLDESLQLYLQLGDDRGATTILHALRAYSLNEPTRLSTLINVEERLRIYQETGDRMGAAEMFQLLADNALYVGDFAASEQYQRQSLELSRQLGIPRLIAFNLMALGSSALIQARYAEGRDHLLECVAISRQYDLLTITSRGLLLLVFAYWGLQDVENLRGVLGEGMSLARAVAVEGIPLGIAGMAALLLLKGQAEDAARLVGLVDAYPGTAADIRLFAVGALRQLLAGILDPEVLAAALERGRALDYDLTVAAIISELNG